METSRHPKLDSDNIDALTEAIEIAVPPSCAMFTHECGGAASCVAVDAMSSAAGSSVLHAIALLKHKGYTVLCYADGAAAGLRAAS